MREILFRGKSKKTGRHVFGDLFHDRDRTVISWYDESGEYQEEEIFPVTVEQFTGVCDIDGKKIFEGDTVGRDGKIYSVYFYNGKFIASECPFFEAPEGISSYFYDELNGDYGILATEHC